MGGGRAPPPRGRGDRLTSAGDLPAIGIVSPWPPTRSGVADYAAEQAAALERLAPRVVRFAPAAAAKAAAAGAGLDVLLAHVGNDPLHLPTVEMLAERGRTVPVVVLLHDFALHHLFAAAFLERGRERDYALALERAHGERGRQLGKRALAGERLPVWDLDPWAFPMSAGVISDATAVLVHSRLARGAALREVPGSRVVEVPHHVVPAPRTPREAARARLGLPGERFLAVTLGAVNPSKRVGKLLEALAILPPERRPFLLVGGDVAPDDPLRAQVLALGLASDVRFSGYLTEEEFWLAASAADVAVNLRFPTFGETSGAASRLAGFGLPLVVSDVGWFAELPAEFAVRVAPGAGEVEALAAAFEALGADPEDRRRRSEAALAWGEERRPDRVARLVLQALREAAEGRSRAAGIAGRLGLELGALGLGRAERGGSGDRGPDARVVLAAAQAAAGILQGGGGASGK